MAEPPDIDLGGDVYLLIGPEASQVGIKVLSSLLVLISPYFCTLFGPRFREGADVADGKEIRLEDDDLEAFTLLCRIIHMKCALSDQPLSLEELLELAIVADKYQCVGALALTFNSIFPTDSTALSFSATCKLVVASYLFDHPRFFRQFTRELVLEYSTSILKATRLPCASRMPLHAWFELECKRSKARLKLTKFLTLDGAPSCSKEKCPRATVLYGRYSQHLRAKGVLPLDFGKTSIVAVTTKLRHVATPSEDGLPGKCSSYCIPDSPLGLSKGFASLANLVDTQFMGLCIDCVRAEGESDAPCRVLHG